MKNVFSLFFAVSSLALLYMASGCSLCCAPYDYCGPVYANGCCANLARQRCGTAFNQTQVPQQVTYDANGQPIPLQNQPARAPQHIPGDTPAQTSMMHAPSVMQQDQRMASPQYQAQYQQAPYRQASANPTARPAQQMMQAQQMAPAQQMAQAPQMAMLPAEPSAPSAQATANGTIAVNADGFQKVAVYDENQQLLSYEIIDATGKSVQQLPAPDSVR